MISITVRAAIGAGVTISNNLQGTAIEYQGKAISLTLYGNGDIAGMNHTLFGHQGESTQVFIPPGAGLGIASTVGKIKTNEDFIGQWAIPGGSRLVHAITNPGAASNIIFQYMVG